MSDIKFQSRDAKTIVWTDLDGVGAVAAVINGERVYLSVNGDGEIVVSSDSSFVLAPRSSNRVILTLD